MRYKPGHREESRAKILIAAGRGFRKHGYGGVGIDGLANEAGVTSGAFYGHFSSKEEAFKEAVVSGLRDVKEALERLQVEHGSNWIECFVDFYVSEKRTCDLAEACALQVLTYEVARSNISVRSTCQAELAKVMEVVANGLPQGTQEDRFNRAWTFISLLVGGVTMARSLADDTLSAAVAQSVRAAALAIAHQGRVV